MLGRRSSEKKYTQPIKQTAHKGHLVSEPVMFITPLVGLCLLVSQTYQSICRERKIANNRHLNSYWFCLVHQLNKKKDTKKKERKIVLLHVLYLQH
jgi:hypothetical protein